jgi:hypothetical protein
MTEWLRAAEFSLASGELRLTNHSFENGPIPRASVLECHSEAKPKNLLYLVIEKADASLGLSMTS